MTASLLSQAAAASSLSGSSHANGAAAADAAGNSSNAGTGSAQPESSSGKTAFKKPTTALSRWKKLTGTAMFINRLGKEQA